MGRARAGRTGRRIRPRAGPPATRWVSAAAGPRTGARSRSGTAGRAARRRRPPAGMNPYAKMKAPTGGFDLRAVDDGIPAANVRQGRSKAVIITSVVVGAGAFVLGGWAGGISVARTT